MMNLQIVNGHLIDIPPDMRVSRVIHENTEGFPPGHWFSVSAAEREDEDCILYKEVDIYPYPLDVDSESGSVYEGGFAISCGWPKLAGDYQTLDEIRWAVDNYRNINSL